MKNKCGYLESSAVIFRKRGEVGRLRLCAGDTNSFFCCPVNHLFFMLILSFFDTSSCLANENVMVTSAPSARSFDGLYLNSFGFVELRLSDLSPAISQVTFSSAGVVFTSMDKVSSAFTFRSSVSDVGFVISSVGFFTASLAASSDFCPK